MTTITRERLEQYAYDKHMCNINDEIREMARIVLASLEAEPVGYFRRYDPDAETLISQCSKNADDSFPLYTHAQSKPITADVERDAQRYRFLRDKDAFGDDGEPGLATWDDLIELDMNEFDAAIDARMAHPSIDFLALDKALQKHERRRCKDRNCNKQIFGYSVDGLCEDCYTAISQQPAPVVPDVFGYVLCNHGVPDTDFVFADRDSAEGTAEHLNDSDTHDVWTVEPICRAAMFQGSQPVSNRDELSSPVIPDGYALVPKEPTEAMLLLLGLTGSFTAMDAAYQKMLAASPLHSATSTDI